MKARFLIALAIGASMLATRSLGQDPVLTSFEGAGQLSWTNPVNGNALYHVE